MKNLPTPLIAAAVFALLFLLERFFSAAQNHPVVDRAALCEPRYCGIHIHRGGRLGATGGAMGTRMACGQAVWTCPSRGSTGTARVRAQFFTDGSRILLLACG